MRLENLASSKDNNLNLIRIILATAVLISHSYPLALGPQGVDPLYKLVGMTMGSVAVDLFFLTSGFLVTASLLRKRSAIDFGVSRALRIYPALFLALILTVFVMGAHFTTLPSSNYFLSKEIYIYLYKNIILITGGHDKLPGLFKDNPYPEAVNGSLWTLTYEVLMYLILATLWTVLHGLRKDATHLFCLSVLLIACASGTTILLLKTTGMTFPRAAGVTVLSKLSFMFFSGGSFYIFRHKVNLSGPAFLTIFVLLFASAAYDAKTFQIFYLLSAGYILFYLAYVPQGRIRAYNRIGDYSYGVYIFAFPIQQTVAALYPGISWLSMTLISIPIVLMLAIASWHGIEKPALAARERCAEFFSRLLGHKLTQSNHLKRGNSRM